jgi:hypothetical protein
MESLERKCERSRVQRNLKEETQGRNRQTHRGRESSAESAQQRERSAEKESVPLGMTHLGADAKHIGSSYDVTFL